MYSSTSPAPSGHRLQQSAGCGTSRSERARRRRELRRAALACLWPQCARRRQHVASRVCARTSCTLPVPVPVARPLERVEPRSPGAPRPHSTRRALRSSDPTLTPAPRRAALLCSQHRYASVAQWHSITLHSARFTHSHVRVCVMGPRTCSELQALVSHFCLQIVSMRSITATDFFRC